MSRVLALCFLLLAAVIGFLHIDSRPAWAPFAINAVTSVEEVDVPAPSPSKNQSIPSKASIPSPISTWLPDTGAASVHAASLIALKDGAIRAFWFAGSREGAADVVINSAVFDPKSSDWSAPTVVMDRVSAEKGLSRYIAKLGNPVPARMADGRLQLFFVTVSIGGWVGSSISSVISDDEGGFIPGKFCPSHIVRFSNIIEEEYIGHRVKSFTCRGKLAEEVGFEPTRPFRACRFSRPVQSTTLPLLRILI